MPRPLASLRQRNIYNLKYRSQRMAKEAKADQRRRRAVYRVNETAVRMAQHKHGKAMLLRRKEDYELGPLAPARDLDSSEPYAVTPEIATRHHPKPMTLRRPEAQGQWVVKGDRVVILKGADRGTIGVVKEVDRIKETLYVKGLHKIETPIPKLLREHAMGKQIKNTESELAWEEVRLVATLPNPVTGKLRDVIVENVEVERIGEDVDTRLPRYSRWPRELGDALPLNQFLSDDEGAAQLREMYQSGTLPLWAQDIYKNALYESNDMEAQDQYREAEAVMYEMEEDLMGRITQRLYEIPYPENEPLPKENKPDDTRRADAEEDTFFLSGEISLKKPPMPPSVIDELRDKHSRLRTRFTLREEEQERRKEYGRKLALQQRASMRTPTEELRALYAEKKRLDKRKGEGAAEQQNKDKFLSDIGALLAARAAASGAEATRSL